MNVPPLGWFWAVLQATLLSTGGFGNLPALHNETVTIRHWATERQFAEALVLGQVSPGPNGLWVVCLGYLLGGVGGGVLAALAVVLPPLLIVPVERWYRRVQHHPHVEGFVTGLGLAVVGVGVFVLGRVFIGTSGGAWWARVLLACAAAGLMASRRVPFLLILVLAAFAGAFLPR